jgi:alkylhydroperoxidase family enzyme
MALLRTGFDWITVRLRGEWLRGRTSQNSSSTRFSEYRQAPALERACRPPLLKVYGRCMPRERNRKYTASTRGPHALDRGERETLVVPMARGHSAGRGHRLHPARRWRAMVRIEHTLLVGVWPPNRAKAIARKPHYTTKVTSAAKRARATPWEVTQHPSQQMRGVPAPRGIGPGLCSIRYVGFRELCTSRHFGK